MHPAGCAQVAIQPELPAPDEAIGETEEEAIIAEMKQARRAKALEAWNRMYQWSGVDEALRHLLGDLRRGRVKDAKFRLILIESRIHRTSRYYKGVKALPPSWKYESATASTLVS